MNKFLNYCLLTSLAVFVLTEMNLGNCTLVLDHVHEYAEEYVIDEDYHWNECECGSKINFEKHLYGPWSYYKKAEREDPDGILSETCLVCGNVHLVDYTYNNLYDYQYDVGSKCYHLGHNCHGNDDRYGVYLDEGEVNDYFTSTYYLNNDYYFYCFKNTSICLSGGLYLVYEGGEYLTGPVIVDTTNIYDQNIINEFYSLHTSTGILYSNPNVFHVQGYFYPITNPTGNLTYKFQHLESFVVEEYLPYYSYNYKISYYDDGQLICELFVITCFDFPEDYFTQYLTLIDR